MKPLAPSPTSINRSFGWPGLVLILGVMAALMLPGAGAPWVERHHFASAAFATMARNHLELGLEVTKGASVLRVDPRHPQPIAIYAHHPFGYPLLLAAVFRVAGATELAARGTAIACSLATTCLLFALMRRAFAWPTALVAAAFFGLAPGTLCDGRIVSLEQPVLVAIVAAISRFDRWLTTGTRRDYWLLVGVLVAGMLIEWQAYYLSAILPVAAWLLGPRPAPWRPLIGLALVAPLMFALFLGHIGLADPDQFGDLYRTMLFRMGLLDSQRQLAESGQVTGYSLGEFLSRMAGHLRTELTWPLCALAVAGIGSIAWQMRREPAARRQLAIPLLLAAPAACHTLFFSGAMYIHDCLSILYLPAAATAGAIALQSLWNNERWRRAGVLASLVVVAFFLRSSLRATKALHLDNVPDAWLIGTEVAAATRADDAVLLLGVPYNPAVFWYAHRELLFVDDDVTLVGRGDRPALSTATVAAVVRGTLEYIDLPAPDFAGSRRFHERTTRAWQFVRQSFKPTGETERLLIYRPAAGKTDAAGDASNSSAAATNAASS